MEKDTIKTDSLSARPLPKWLTDQRDGLNSYQPEKVVLQKDNSLNIAFISTGIVVLITVIFLTIFILRRNKKHR
jgi:hypothetical protein